PAEGDQWAATIADRLYERQILSKAGREELKRQLADGRLFDTYSMLGSSRDRVLNGATPAAVLRFCAQTFEAAEMQRSASLTERQTQ
nr:hypothetical protein [Tanacetum cinerariifolium]